MVHSALPNINKNCLSKCKYIVKSYFFKKYFLIAKCVFFVSSGTKLNCKNYHYLFEAEIFFNSINVSTATFSYFNASLINKSIIFLTFPMVSNAFLYYYFNMNVIIYIYILLLFFAISGACKWRFSVD